MYVTLDKLCLRVLKVLLTYCMCMYDYVCTICMSVLSQCAPLTLETYVTWICRFFICMCNHSAQTLREVWSLYDINESCLLYMTHMSHVTYERPWSYL